MACHDLYMDQLASLNNGHALWEPNPNEPDDQVEVGDVGYILFGGFHRLFNIHLPADHPAQGQSLPEHFEPLECPRSHIYRRTLRPGPYMSRSVVAAEIDTPFAVPMAGGQISLKFSCSRRRGAVLVLPEDAQRVDTRSRAAYEDYTREHCERWHALTDRLRLGLRLEDHILVTGCDRTTTWAVAAFTSVDFDSRISLSVDFAGVGSASFASSMSWTHDGSAQYNWGPDQRTSVSTAELTRAVTSGGEISSPSAATDQLQKPINTKFNQCVFVRGFRAKRRSRFLPVKLKAAAEPVDLKKFPDEDFDGGEGAVSSEELDSTGDFRDLKTQIEVIADTQEHTDMTAPLLDYILQTSDIDLAIVHDDDLKPYTKDAISASDIASRLAENPPKVIKTAMESGTRYGSLARPSRPGSISSPTSTADDTDSSQPRTPLSTPIQPSLQLALEIFGPPQAIGRQPSGSAINIEAIEAKIESRTTVMFKSLPRRMTGDELLDFIAQVCPRRVDFVYVKMDTRNGCNLGTAFVNFMTTGDLLSFAKARLGTKWDMLSSSRVVQMIYANYQFVLLSVP
ncbi:hypothetical protein EVG20_g7374 [Dentipellis fragilis]|uniref:Mei2-like C-terminal RNA recognition motif domain-containing protein n=1 Tax=Dentipellis fragilis TaxID=205917 RepID=A0A4Y9YEZ3_9AGAM|nr:hypothetical protein EVG20_g7374 [Dentipellis fragilis]